MARVPGVVIKSSNGFYKLKTSHGVLDRQFRTDELEKCEIDAFEAIDDFTEKKVVTLREAAKRFNRREKEVSACKCKFGYNSRKCPCKKMSLSCTTKCHAGKTCKNIGMVNFNVHEHLGI